MATLTVTANEDYSDGNPPLSNITDIVFNTSGFVIATFSAVQFDNVQISQSVHITGDANSNWINVFMPVAGTFSIANWTYTNFGVSDSIFINGSAGNDTLVGSDTKGATFLGGDGADNLAGGAQPDLFRYLGSADVEAGEAIDGGGGNDSIQVDCNGSSYDFSAASIVGVGQLLLNLGGGVNTATVILSGDHIGTSDGISEVDTGAGFTNHLVVVGGTVDLSPVTFVDWDFDDTITINGTGGIDTLTGSDQADAIRGFGGGDAQGGGTGNDTFRIAGSEGIGDTFAGGSGTDKLQVVGAGVAKLSAFNAAASSVEQWQGNNKGLFGTSDPNTLNFAGLSSKSGLPFVDGVGGSDKITGTKFADKLLGGSGNDALNGGLGNDTLTGGTGKDLLTGGNEKDTFDFNAAGESVVGVNRDQILDFSRGQGDKIHLKDIDAKTGIAGNNAFKFIGTGSFNDVKGELRFIDLGSKCVVQGDVNGNGTADFEIRVNVGTILEADFFL